MYTLRIPLNETHNNLKDSLASACTTVQASVHMQHIHPSFLRGPSPLPVGMTFPYAYPSVRPKISIERFRYIIHSLEPSCRWSLSRTVTALCPRSLISHVHFLQQTASLYLSPPLGFRLSLLLWLSAPVHSLELTVGSHEPFSSSLTLSSSSFSLTPPPTAPPDSLFIRFLFLIVLPLYSSSPWSLCWHLLPLPS